MKGSGPGRRAPGPGDGTGILRSAWIGTAAFVVASLAGALAPPARLAVAVVDLALFFAGCVVFMWALLVAAGRSRQREIGLWNLFLLDQVAPARVRAALLGALAVEVAVALGTAWITAALAFGCLVPIWGLAHSGLWGARYGTFGPRRPGPARRPRGQRA
jgi:hypothetical protein